MKATSDFSWTKLLCFYGAGFLALLACVILAAGILLITKGVVFNGIGTILGAIATGAWAVYLYKYYQKLDAAGKPGTKAEDVKKEDRK
jgi:hypothetical protein